MILVGLFNLIANHQPSKKDEYIPKKVRYRTTTESAIWTQVHKVLQQLSTIETSIGKCRAPKKAKHRTRGHSNSLRYSIYRRILRLNRTERRIDGQPANPVQGKVTNHHALASIQGKNGPTTTTFDSDAFNIAIDNCCSKCISNSAKDFVGKLTPVHTKIKGIGGNVRVKYKGTVKWTIVDDDGVAKTFRIPDVYLNEESPYRLLSPQHLAQVLQRQANGEAQSWCTTFGNSVVLYWDAGKSKKTVPLDSSTNIAIMRSAEGYQKFKAFCHEIEHPDNTATVQLHGMITEPYEIEQHIVTDDEGNTTEDDNDDDDDNITINDDNGHSIHSRLHPDLPVDILAQIQKSRDAAGDNYVTLPEDNDVKGMKVRTELLAWHYRLGHISFAKIKAMSARGDLPSYLKHCEAPKCAACLYGKLTRTPWRSKPSKSDSAKPITHPGQVIAVDQLISSTPGLVAQMAGFITKKRYHAATVFVDTYSNLSYVFLQKSTTAEETIEAKRSFEKYARSFGVYPKHYHADNGIFQSKLFEAEIEAKGQSITFAGVNAHHQNGQAEKKIRDLRELARTMLLHANHRWDDAITTNLWPYALRLASENLNAAPDPSTGSSPIERFSGVDVSPRVRHSHTFGCPVYVLDNRLQTTGGAGIDKWQKRSRIGVYLGPSPRHSRRVALVLSLQTGLVSPQFHTTFDDYFETVKAGTKNVVPKSEWQSKTGFRHGKSPKYAQATEQNDEGATPQIPPTDDLFPVAERVEQTVDETPRQDDIAAPDPPGMVPQQVTNARTTRSGRVSKPTKRWQESMEQQASGIVSLQVAWEVFHDNEYDVQQDMDDPIAFLQETESNDVYIYEDPVAYAASNNPDILYVNEALRAPDKAKFIEAMKLEVQSHTDNDHWKVVEKSTVPKGVTILPAVWAMRRKRRIATNETYKWKARLNVHGGKQVHNVNYWETYAPVIMWTTIRFFLVQALVNNWATRQIDFVLAYPQAEIEVPMYMEIPKAFSFEGSRKTHCLLLIRNLYGQKQAGRVWNKYLHDGLLARGFVQSQVDPCLYFRGQVILMIYTDDGILIGPKAEDIDEVIELIKNPVMKNGKQRLRAFNITDEGDINEYLGVKVERLANGAIKLSQPHLIQQVITDLGFNDKTKIQATPAASTVRLHRDVHGAEYNEAWHYRSVIGKLNYIEKSTRPDIAYAVHQCARFCNDPKESHAAAVKRIGKYLLGTKDRGIVIQPNRLSFECYADADFVGNWNRVTAHEDPSTAKSRTAYIIRYAGCPITWASKLQTDVALSSTEAEYSALSESLRQVIYMIQLVDEAKSLGWKIFDGAPVVHCKAFEDNAGALELVRLPKLRPRTKHICIRYHHFREHVRLGKISIEHVPSEQQLADIATKPQPEKLFVDQREMIMNWAAEDQQTITAVADHQLRACDDLALQALLPSRSPIESWVQIAEAPNAVISRDSVKQESTAIPMKAEPSLLKRNAILAKWAKGIPWK